LRGFGGSGVVEEIRAAGGEIFAVTSEPQSLATEAREAWVLEFETVGDPHHEIFDQCRNNDWLDLYIGDGAEPARGRSWASHPNGFFQPGILALTRDRRVLYRWRSRPTHKNRGGATSRATPTHVWSQIQHGLVSESDARWDTDPELDSPDAFWPLFVAQLFAHGWFIRPKRFPLGRLEDERSTRPSAMRPRLIAFSAAWALGLLLLPTRLVLLALAGYLAAIAPAIRRTNREFQSIPADETSGHARQHQTSDATDNNGHSQPRGPL
jgi:hypothetical protein